MTLRKLSWEQSRLIQKLYALGRWKQQDIAEQFGITQPQVSNIIRDRAYVLPTKREQPTPHELMTIPACDRIHARGRWDRMPPDEIRERHGSARLCYAQQNARDGYLFDPEYIAAVRGWRADTTPLAAD